MDSPSPSTRSPSAWSGCSCATPSLQRANALLTAQVVSLTQERDSLRSRLNTARTRIDALLEKMPPPPADAPATPTDLPKEAE